MLINRCRNGRLRTSDRKSYFFLLICLTQRTTRELLFFTSTTMATSWEMSFSVHNVLHYALVRRDGRSAGRWRL